MPTSDAGDAQTADASSTDASDAAAAPFVGSWESRACTPTDNTTCPAQPATNSTNAGSFLHDSSWIVVGNYPVMFVLGDGGAELRIDRDAPVVWTRAQ